MDESRFVISMITFQKTANTGLPTNEIILLMTDCFNNIISATKETNDFIV